MCCFPFSPQLLNHFLNENLEFLVLIALSTLTRGATDELGRFLEVLEFLQYGKGHCLIP
jgi:hypothetical protein